VLLLFLTYGLDQQLGSVWRTYRGWVVMLPIVLAAVFAGRTAIIVGVALLAITAFKEFARATGLYRDWWMTGAVYLGIVAVAATSLVRDPWLNLPGWYGLFMALPVYIVCLILVIPIARNRAKGQLQSTALAIVGFVYLGWMFSHVGFLANSPHAYGYLLFLVLAVEGNDVAAFTCGKLFGRRKLREAISPNKTWGGSVGAVAVSMALPWLVRFSFPHFGPLQLLLTGAIVGVGGQLGDLTISMIKRDVGVKDMGALIPGHGGLLDRIDSLIFVGPLFFHMVRWFYDVY
jgi:phosphatidate cytidylyltransferase